MPPRRLEPLEVAGADGVGADEPEGWVLVLEVPVTPETTFCTVEVAAPVAPLATWDPVLATPLPTPLTTLLTPETAWLGSTVPLVALLTVLPTVLVALPSVLVTLLTVLLTPLVTLLTVLLTPLVTLLTVWLTPLVTLLTVFPAPAAAWRSPSTVLLAPLTTLLAAPEAVGDDPAAACGEPDPAEPPPLPEPGAPGAETWRLRGVVGRAEAARDPVEITAAGAVVSDARGCDGFAADPADAVPDDPEAEDTWWVERVAAP